MPWKIGSAGRRQPSFNFPSSCLLQFKHHPGIRLQFPEITVNSVRTVGLPLGLEQCADSLNRHCFAALAMTGGTK